MENSQISISSLVKLSIGWALAITATFVGVHFVVNAQFQTIHTQLRMFENNIDQKVQALSDTVDRGFEALDKRFEATDTKFESIDSRLDRIEVDIAAILMTLRAMQNSQSSVN